MLASGRSENPQVGRSEGVHAADGEASVERRTISIGVRGQGAETEDLEPVYEMTNGRYLGDACDKMAWDARGGGSRGHGFRA